MGRRKGFIIVDGGISSPKAFQCWQRNFDTQLTTEIPTAHNSLGQRFYPDSKRSEFGLKCNLDFTRNLSDIEHKKQYLGEIEIKTKSVVKSASITITRGFFGYLESLG